MTHLQGPPPGWYPIDERHLGFWDGSRWAYLPTIEPPRSPIGEPRRELPRTASWTAVVVGFVLAIGMTVGIALLTADVRTASTAWLIVGVTPIWQGMLVGCVIASNRSGVPTLESWGLPRTRAGWWRAIGIGVGLGVAIRIAAGIAALPFIPFIDDTDDFPFGQVAPYFDIDTTLLWTFAVVAVVGAPLFEEAFFRGVLQGTLVGRFGTVATLGLQGVIFGAVHADPSVTAIENLMTVTVITVAGVGFGWLFHWTRTIVTAVVAHATFNLVAVGFIVAYPWLEEIARSS